MLRIVINTKVNIKMIKNVDLVRLLGNQVINTEAVIKTMNDMAMVRCIGLMVVVTKVNG